MNSFPHELREAKCFCIDNPLSLYRNAQRNRQQLEKRSENLLNEEHEMAVEMLAEIFNWLDGLESQAITRSAIIR